jgi:hypothetical protein
VSSTLRSLVVISISISTAAALGLGRSAEAQPATEYSGEGAQACLDCHETEQVMGIAGTSHADFDDPRTPAAQKQCESCHGPSTVHMQFPMQVANVHFGKASAATAAVQNQRCLACHTDGEQKDWEASAHGFENVLCSSCHSLHTPDALVPSRATVEETCITEACHGDLMKHDAPMDFAHRMDLPGDDKPPKHTPGAKLADGQSFRCTDCHNPHGLLNEARCLDCHEQRPETLALQGEKARRFHEVAERRGTSCLRCHRDVAHPLPEDVLEAARQERVGHEAR